MAQTQTVTDEGIEELVLLWSGSTACSAMKGIVCMSATAVCTAASSNTFASPAATLFTTTSAPGLAIADATISTSTTSSTGDLILFDHEFTATGSFQIAGIQVLNDDDDCSYVECCFASLVNAEATDTLTIDGQVQVEQAT